MPTINADQLSEKTQALKSHIKEKGEALEGAERRALGKKLRRLQRKRRRVLALQQPASEASADAPSDAAPDKSPSGTPDSEQNKDESSSP